MLEESPDTGLVFQDADAAPDHDHHDHTQRHERHLHPNCDEFLVVLAGSGEIYTTTGRAPSQAGDVIYTPRGNWHGFDNTSDEDVLLFWGWSGAGSLEAAGYAIPGPDETFDE